METAMLVVAGGAAGLAILIAIVNKMKGTAQQPPVGSFAPMVAKFAGNVAKPKGPPPHPSVGQRSTGKKPRNKRGWRAPEGHYFNENDELYNDAGSLILDAATAAVLCGEQYSEIGGCGHEESVAPVEEIEPIISATEACKAMPSEVTSESSFSDLQTAEDTTRYSAPEPSYDDGGGDSYDSGGGDDGGDCGGDD